MDGQRPSQREAAMKIYLLMVLVSVIAALSHYKSEPKSPEQQA